MVGREGSIKGGIAEVPTNLVDKTDPGAPQLTRCLREMWGCLLAAHKRVGSPPKVIAAMLRNFTFAFHDNEEIGPVMLARIAKKTRKAERSVIGKRPWNPPLTKNVKDGALSGGDKRTRVPHNSRGVCARCGDVCWQRISASDRHRRLSLPRSGTPRSPSMITRRLVP